MINNQFQRGFGFFLVFLLLSPAYAEEPAEVVPEVPRYEPSLYPFDSGEQALYRASWNGIPVATAEIHTDPLWIGEKKYFRVFVSAKTFSVVDLFWKMRDTVISVFEAETLLPHRYEFNQRENSKKIDTRAVFVAADQKWLVQRVKGSKNQTHEIASANTLDPVTAVYLARSIDFKVGDRLQFVVFGGKSRYHVTLHVAGRETIELQSGGTHDAFKIVPQVKNISKSGYADKLQESTVWISADPSRVPLRITSKVMIGTVYLEKVDQLDQAGRSAPKS